MEIYIFTTYEVTFVFKHLYLWPKWMCYPFLVSDMKKQKNILIWLFLKSGSVNDAVRLDKQNKLDKRTAEGNYLYSCTAACVYNNDNKY